MLTNDVQIYFIDTVIIGTGCAGYNTADTLYRQNKKDIAIITNGKFLGTSRNTGSDKQTYYKLSLSGGQQDSVFDMAKDLFQGGAMHGDTALNLAASSVEAFMKLVYLGVPFPKNDFGEYVGYQTDHDQRQRATSCGPLTSKCMTEALEKEIEKHNIKIFDHHHVIKIITENNCVKGVLALHQTKDASQLVLFVSNNVVMATGGPATCYLDSVYPTSQAGLTGLALLSGAKGVNLCEWQYGLASIDFRWNVSGTYQQVLPRYVSVDQEGNEREFLYDYFNTKEDALYMEFLKGYQWPFDSKKVAFSSLIDLIVHNETKNKGNKVYLDFRQDPMGLENFDNLHKEAYTYLKNSDALVKKPIERLKIMNKKAIELYKAHNIDLETQMLQIAVCAQHLNGGIEVDKNCMSSVQNLYVVGEAAGDFGIYRPGGTALNATQVDSMHAANSIVEHIAPLSLSFCHEQALAQTKADITALQTEGKESLNHLLVHFESLMSQHAGHIRNPHEMKKLFDQILSYVKNYFVLTKATEETLVKAYYVYDMMLVQLGVLSANMRSASSFKSRGGALVLNPQEESNFKLLKENALKGYTPLTSEQDNLDTQVVTSFDSFTVTSSLQKVRPLVLKEDWFEKVWNKQ